MELIGAEDPDTEIRAIQEADQSIGSGRKKNRIFSKNTAGYSGCVLRSFFQPAIGDQLHPLLCSRNSPRSGWAPKNRW